MMVEIDTLYFRLKRQKKKNIPFGAAHTYIAYVRDYPPPPSFGAKNALQVISLAAFASETNKLQMHPSKSKLLFIGSSYNLNNKISEQPVVLGLSCRFDL